MNRRGECAFDGSMWRSVFLLVPAVAALAAGCVERSATRAAEAPPVADRLPYRLAEPDTVVALAPSLREISGLAWLPPGRLAAVQDERGTVFELDPATGAIVRETPFRDGGDFEGIEWAAGALWVLKSNGDLYRLVAGEPVEEIETPLASRNDAEGLGWDPATGRLLIACKEDPGDGLGRVRAVYAFDPATRRLSAAPVVTLSRDRLDAGGESFKPSAIAVHPQSGHTYILSSVRRALAVVDADGALVAVGAFPARLLPQPEGLAFAPDGTLYVSSEGAGGSATLARYTPAAD